MKKYITLTLCLLLCAVLLSGCGCKHETWNEADCLNPKTCAECGEIEGEALGHTWADATCEVPKTCTACGETEGETLGHSWADATCEAPKTCTACGETEGEALGHSLGEWTEIDMENEERICSACGYAEQQVIDRKAKVLTLLEGDWVLKGFYIDGEVYNLDQIVDSDQWTSSLHFNIDKSVKHTYVSGDENSYVINFDNYFEYESAGDIISYTFVIENDLDSYVAILFINSNGVVRVYCQFDQDLWIFAPVA